MRTIDEICEEFRELENTIGSSEAMAAILEVEFAARATQKPAYQIPGPYEIAMAFGAAMVASGKCDTIGAAMAQAWAAVPEFYQARDMYVSQIAPMMYGGDMTNGEVAEGGIDPAWVHPRSRATPPASEEIILDGHS